MKQLIVETAYIFASNTSLIEFFCLNSLGISFLFEKHTVLLNENEVPEGTSFTLSYSIQMQDVFDLGQYGSHADPIDDLQGVAASDNA